MIEINSIGQMLMLVNSKDKVTVIDFYADWCGPCQQIKPEYERISQYYDPKQVNFCKCNVDRNRECAAHFNIRAMPTFVVCHAGTVLQTVQGGDLGTVQRQVDMGVALLQQQGGGRVAPSASAPAPSAQGKHTAASPLAKAFIRVAQGGADAGKVAAACEEVLAALQADTASHTFGLALIPYLASECFSAAALGAFLRHLAARPAPDAVDGTFLVSQVLRCVVEVAAGSTWTQVPLLRQLAQAVWALLQCEEAQPMVAASPLFDHGFVLTGQQLERQTVLGALLGVGPVSKASPAGVFMERVEAAELMQMFPYADKPGRQQKVYEVQMLSEQLAQSNCRLVHAFLACRVTRDRTLRFLGKALTLNEDYQKIMHTDSPLSSRYFMAQLQAVLIHAALPVVTRNFTPAAIPSCYVIDVGYTKGGQAVVGFGDPEELERVVHFGDEQSLPSPPASIAAEGYKASTHLFFLAARAVTLVACVMLDEHKRMEQNASHPQSSAQQKEYCTAVACIIEGIIGATALSQSRLQFLNGLSQWLLHVMGADRAGRLPPTPPQEWGYLPQGLVDCAIRGTLMTKVDALFIDGIVAMLLVLMGNTLYFPKPHTHALFPAFLLDLLQVPDCRKRLEEHPWFAENIVRGCIHCYIAVEKCTYDKVQVRYNLSYCIKTFLQYPSLCVPVEKEFQQEGTILERFSHMAVADVNEAVDQVIERLRKMNELAASGADLSETAVAQAPQQNGAGNGGDDGRRQRQRQRQRDGNRGDENEESDEESDEGADDGGNMTYHQMGLRLRSDIQLFTSYMDMFIELSIRFPRGVSQNMVASQISQMLARSLVMFVGPKSRTLKIENAERYGFRPRDILSRLVDCLTHFRRSSNFVHFLCQCGVPLPDILQSMSTTIQKKLVSETLTWKLGEMKAAVEAQSQEVQADEAMWDEAPDYALDALLSTPLLHPVALPAEVKDLDDLVYVNRDTIHHFLLSENKHPYTKEFLDEAMVEQFNKRPAVAEHRAKVEQRIQEWVRQAKANRAAKK